MGIGAQDHQHAQGAWIPSHPAMDSLGDGMAMAEQYREQFYGTNDMNYPYRGDSTGKTNKQTNKQTVDYCIMLMIALTFQIFTFYFC